MSRFPFAGHMSWYPGHMAKATRLIESKLKAADVVIEVRDARVRLCVLATPCHNHLDACAVSRAQVPFSSQNFMLEPILQQKPRIVVFNKSDLADDALQPKVAACVASHRTHVMFTTAIDRHSMKQACTFMLWRWARLKHNGSSVVCAVGVPREAAML
jgi:ribosome biogenesis GTPase A